METLALNYRLWTKDFGVAWESINLEEKVIWMFLFANTISLLTLFEVALLTSVKT